MEMSPVMTRNQAKQQRKEKYERSSKKNNKKENTDASESGMNRPKSSVKSRESSQAKLVEAEREGSKKSALEKAESALKSSVSGSSEKLRLLQAEYEAERERLLELKNKIQMLHLEKSERSRTSSKASKAEEKLITVEKQIPPPLSETSITSSWAYSYPAKPSHYQVESWVEGSPLVENAQQLFSLDKYKYGDKNYFPSAKDKNRCDKKYATRVVKPRDMIANEQDVSFSHYVARQGGNKDLPIFAGDPLEWPVFFSNFERTTRACGYSEEENIVRVQRALRGKALEAVSGLLPFPSCLGQVINTLHMRFGRTEYIVKRLIANVENLPPPKEERLESIMDFATAVQNLVVMLENSGCIAHLSNPQLLEDLVLKLPPRFRLSWGEWVIDSQREYGDLSSFANY